MLLGVEDSCANCIRNRTYIFQHRCIRMSLVLTVVLAAWLNINAVPEVVLLILRPFMCIKHVRCWAHLRQMLSEVALELQRKRKRPLQRLYQCSYESLGITDRRVEGNCRMHNS